LPHQDDSFKNMNKKEKTATIIGISLLIILVTVFVLGVFLFGFAGLFTLLGVDYHSVWSLVTFVIFLLILGSAVDIVFDTLAERTVQYISGNVKSFIMQILIGFVSNWIVLVIVDGFMDSIMISAETKWIIALFLALVESVFDNKKDK